MTDVTVTPDELDAAIEAARGGGRAVRVLDVRWRLDQPDGREAFAAGHIPGAVYVDLDTELAEHGEPADGRHPLPSRERLQAAARGWGLDDGDLVVAYDDYSSMAAARAWWMLTDAGVDTRILDGGLKVWSAAGRPLETGAVRPARGSVTLASGILPQLTIDGAAEFAATGVLLDARAPERYRGEHEPVDPRAGHIPGAANLSAAGNLDADGTFLDPAVLRERALAVGAEPGAPVGVYCGSGVSAAQAAAALTLAGFEPHLYVGSWSQWSNHPDRPVATGAG